MSACGGNCDMKRSESPGSEPPKPSEPSEGFGSDPPKLSELLDRGWRIFEEVDSTNEPLNSSPVQARVKQGISLLEDASRMAAQLQLFSRNEELEEVSTSDLKYLLLPALLGALTLKRSGRERRLESLRAARVYFMDFLTRCQDYHIARFSLPRPGPRDTDQDRDRNEASDPQPVQPAADLVSMAAQRQAKIERYRQKKELEAKLSDARRAVDTGQADEEVQRDFYLLSVRRWITVGLEEVESIDQELEILEKMGGLQHGPRQPPPTRPPMKPFILTKDAMQAQVFGAGYPSLPTMTVDDWYEQHRKRGVLPDQGVPRRVPVEEDADAKDREDEDKERKAENDDEEALQKARSWDDWKDSHRRGYGNRQNMG
ncbi:immunoglobulin-binding protein 1 [Salarias fasciatus]|uniref:Immunoglobulin (CD79A) binding protein 1 n=1 Tax=Salarias fasciatus TaxID=181472 RepID=A0A672H498_SALFA|nr:immunoglobulin-binding protein 1 [Salarias fasciatus]